MHHLDSWIKRDQLDVTCFIISLFTAQHVSDVNTAILRSLRLICWVISWVVLLWYELRCGLAGVVCEACIRIPHHPSQTTTYHQHTSYQSNTTHEITQEISRKLLRMDVLTSETCWAVNNEIIKQVTSGWSLFIQASPYLTALMTSPPYERDLGFIPAWSLRYTLWTALNWKDKSPVSTDAISGNSSKVRLLTRLSEFIKWNVEITNQSANQNSLSISLNNEPINSVTNKSTNSLTHQQNNEVMIQPNIQLI